MSFKTAMGLTALLTFAPMGMTFAQDNGDAPKPEAKPEAKKETPSQPQGRDRRGRRGRRGRGRFNPVNRMKESLGLSDEQVKKLTAMFEEQRSSRREMFRKMREEGMDRQAMREAFQKGRAEMEKKMGEVLTPEQMEKWKKQREEMRSRFGRRGRRGDRRGRRGRGRRNLKAEALQLLKLGKDEQAVLEPMIDDIVKARQTIRTKQDAFLRQVRETKDAETVKGLLATYRKERDEARAALKKVQGALRETLTPQQEAALVALDLLD